MATWTATHYQPVRTMIDVRMCLDLYERETLFFIFSRTGGFDNQDEDISLTQFMEGIREYATGRYITSPVAISRTKVIESLHHLEAKGIIEVHRGTGIMNNYRIKRTEEINLDFIMSYMERHQPKAYRSIFDRFHRREERRTLSEMVRRSITATVNAARQGSGTSTTGGTGGVLPVVQGVVPQEVHQSIRKDKETKSNIAATDAARYLRPLRKIRTGK